MPSGEHTDAHSGGHSPERMSNWDLVRIFLEVGRFGSFRAAAEQNAKKDYQVKHVVDGIEQSFDARKYPWFGGEFVDPREPLVNLFAGFKKVSRPKPIRFPNRANGSTR